MSEFPSFSLFPSLPLRAYDVAGGLYWIEERTSDPSQAQPSKPTRQQQRSATKLSDNESGYSTEEDIGWSSQQQHSWKTHSQAEIDAAAADRMVMHWVSKAEQLEANNRKGFPSFFLLYAAFVFLMLPRCVQKPL